MQSSLELWFAQEKARHCSQVKNLMKPAGIHPGRDKENGYFCVRSQGNKRSNVVPRRVTEYSLSVPSHRGFRCRIPRQKCILNSRRSVKGKSELLMKILKKAAWGTPVLLP